MKKQDDIITGSLLLTVIGAGILVFAASSLVKFKTRLTPEENVLAGFSPTIPTLAVRQQYKVEGATCPVMPAVKLSAAQPQTAAVPPAFPPGVPPLIQSPGGVVTPSAIDSMFQAKQPAVSMIMLNEGNRLAIIDGKVLREGERFKQGIIVRIEKNQVLLREGKGEKWLRLN